jgi:hypothetical protein
LLADEAQVRMFGLNLYLIIGAVLLLLFLGILLLVTWTALRMGTWRMRQRHAAERELRRRLGTDGRPLPPADRGLCHRCQQVHETVYHLPGGERLCPECYGELLGARDQGSQGRRN